MKVLFAVNNEKIVQSVVKTYQKTHKDVLSYKTVYYFNALVKELQKDKSYDRIIISEDLEPFSNNNYDAIDKFIFDKLDSVSDEAEDDNGNDIPIILICSDRRGKADPLLGKLFGIGVYSAIIGDNRSIDEVCNLIDKPRGKKEAKTYYKIEIEDVKYEAENENNVSETEIQSIISHYKKLGKNEEKFVESFDNIAEQYNDNQLKIIAKFLPLHVKAVLEQKSTKYKEVVVFNIKKNYNNYSKYKNQLPTQAKTMQPSKVSTGIDIVDAVNSNSNKMTKPVIIPGVTKQPTKDIEPVAIQKPADVALDEEDIFEKPDVIETEIDSIDIRDEKRNRGRPRKVQPELVEKMELKRGRGRPKKIEDEAEEISGVAKDAETQNLEVNLFDLDEDTVEETNENIEQPVINEPQQPNEVQPQPILNKPEPAVEEEHISPTMELQSGNMDETPFTLGDTVLNNILAKNKKIVSFIGTSKNGTSFLVNNLAVLFSSMGIKTAVLDMTANKNAYYIFTKNQENLRQVAYNSIENLRKGIDKGVVVNKYLSIFTSLPNQKDIVYDHERILDTLVSNYSLILVDCDFNTPLEYFSVAQEIYIVQSMDILTIQPLTAFLRELKTRKILNDNVVKIILNKYVNCRGLTPKALIGGLAFYNDPAMTFMTELFDKDKVVSFVIPFEDQNYVSYLEGLVDCNISLNRYTKQFMKSLNELGSSVYPLVHEEKGKKQKGASFSNNVNSTLEQMKKSY